MRIFVLGIFGDRPGGANGECLGAAQIWRRNGLDITFIPTWSPPTQPYLQLAKDMGCEVVNVHPRKVKHIPGLAGSTVVNFCNSNAYAPKHDLKKLDCRVIAAPCMCYPESGFRTAMQTGHVDKVVFQSHYQQKMMEQRLRSFGYNPEMAHLIRGYFDWEAVPFAPRPRNTDDPFVIGRIARDSTAKWCKDWWQMYGRVPSCKAIVLGYGHHARRHCGAPPEWATIYPPGGATAESVYGQLHAYVTCNGGVDENWPRVGLEAMAHGVPIVAENDFGWAEMLENGKSALLGKTWKEIGDLAAMLSSDEDLRLRLATAARERLREICDPVTIWEGWKSALDL